jgi:metal transporter CNNM
MELPHGDFDESVHGSLVKQFRARLGDNVKAEHDDRALFKWLKARKCDIDAAEKMYLKSMAWRREIGADSLLTDYTEPEVIHKYFPGGLFGCARDGSPVWIEPMGQGDLKGIVSSVSKDDIVKSMACRLETLYALFRKLTEQHGKPIDKCVHIIDVSGFGIKQLYKPVIDMYIAILRMLEDNYPETLRASYIINAPRVFRTGFEFLKKFIGPYTASKIVMLDDDYQKTLLNLIDADELPKAYGGTKVDENGDPMCRQWIRCGGDVPKFCYLGHTNRFPDGKPLIVETVSQRQTLSVDVDIKQPFTQLSWFFFVDSGNIEFGVKRRRDVTVGEAEDVEPMTKFDCCSTNVVGGSVVCDVSGLYMLQFYNSSFLFSRKLTYCVDVTELGEGGLCTDSPDPTVQDCTTILHSTTL